MIGNDDDAQQTDSLRDGRCCCALTAQSNGQSGFVVIP